GRAAEGDHLRHRRRPRLPHPDQCGRDVAAVRAGAAHPGGGPVRDRPLEVEPDYGHTYTRGRRQPYLIRKWPNSNWVLPLGPYTITQLLVFVGSVYLLLTYRELWAHFGGFNVVIGVGVPAALTYAARHTRVEGRDPVRAGVALVGLLLRPRGGYVNGAPPPRARVRRCPAVRIPVAPHPYAADRAPPRPPARPWVADLVATARAASGGPR